uniref:Uncharacterized protein n=1 Tax=Ditylenchus dipsaci TaxID=166011 RepID=A0A915D6R1_9BILA
MSFVFTIVNYVYEASVQVEIDESKFGKRKYNRGPGEPIKGDTDEEGEADDNDGSENKTVVNENRQRSSYSDRSEDEGDVQVELVPEVMINLEKNEQSIEEFFAGDEVMASWYLLQGREENRKWVRYIRNSILPSSPMFE